MYNRPSDRAKTRVGKNALTHEIAGGKREGVAVTLTVSHHTHAFFFCPARGLSIRGVDDAFLAQGCLFLRDNGDISFVAFEKMSNFLVLRNVNYTSDV